MKLFQLQPYILCYFSGRTNRMQWWAQKTPLVVLTLLIIGDPATGFPDEYNFFFTTLLIYLFVASMALGYRRLIDAGYSPWLLLFMLLGPIGSVILGFIEIFAPSIKHPNL